MNESDKKAINLWVGQLKFPTYRFEMSGNVIRYKHPDGRLWHNWGGDIFTSDTKMLDVVDTLKYKPENYRLFITCMSHPNKGIRQACLDFITACYEESL